MTFTTVYVESTGRDYYALLTSVKSGDSDKAGNMLVLYRSNNDTNSKGLS